MRSVANIKDDIRGILSGINLNNVVNVNGAIERAARIVIQKATIPEASGRQSIILYDGIYDYAAPTTLFGATFLDLRPLGENRNIIDYVYKKPIELFDRTKALLSNGYMIAVEYKNGTAILRIANTKAKARVILDRMDSITDTTNWASSGSAGTISLDNVTFYWSNGSLRFTLTGASSGSLTKTLNNSVDLSTGNTYKDVGVVFVAIDTPNASNLTNLSLKIGSDSSNYSQITGITTAFKGAFQANEFDVVAFDLANATDTGTPDFSKIKYLQVTMAHGATLTNFRLGGIFIALPSQQEILFQSPAIFMASGANPTVTITNDSDSIILNENSYTLLEHESALAIALQTGGKLSSPLVQTLNQTLHGIRARNGAVIQLGLYDLYRAQNPSEEIKLIGNYYSDNF